MAKLSEIFGRKGEVADRPGGTRGKVTGHQLAADNVADVGVALGEENETLRNLLNDAARKIGELDELKEAFEKIVAPFNAALRALEQEKSQTLALNGLLEESRSAYETLRTEFYQVEKKASTLGAEAEKLRIEVELARESNRALESSNLEFANEIAARRAQIVELERQVAQDSAQHRSLTENLRTLEIQLETAEKHNTTVEGELAAAREALALLQGEKQNLQSSLDQAVNETARLNRAFTESENSLTAARAQLGKVEASFAEVSAERVRLSTQLDETREQRKNEQNMLNMRIDALQSRAATAERLLTEARQNLVARTEEVRIFDRKAVEATIARNNAENRMTQVEAIQETRERKLKDLEQTRTALTERNDGIAKLLKTREAALARAEEKIAAMTERNGRLEADVQVIRTNIEKRVEKLNSSLQRERMERAVVEGALEAARKDNSRLQGEVASLRAMLRRGQTLDDGPVTPQEAANDEPGKAAEPPVVEAAPVARKSAETAQVARKK